jgi:hypothetical protein
MISFESQGSSTWFSDTYSLVNAFSGDFLYVVSTSSSSYLLNFSSRFLILLTGDFGK